MSQIDMWEIENRHFDIGRADDGEGGNIRAADGQSGLGQRRLGLGLGDLLGGDIHDGIRGSLGIGGGSRGGRLRGVERIVLRGRAGNQLCEQHGYA